jgi:hypothetical protein
MVSVTALQSQDPRPAAANEHTIISTANQTERHGGDVAQGAVDVDVFLLAPLRGLAKHLSEGDEPTIAVPSGPVV